MVADLFENHEQRDVAEVIPEQLPEPIQYVSHRDYVRAVLDAEVGLSAVGADFVTRGEESKLTRGYRDQLNADGSPTDIIAASYVWQPGTELTAVEAGAMNIPDSFKREQIRRSV
jgi:hypothetical protein